MTHRSSDSIQCAVSSVQYAVTPLPLALQTRQACKPRIQHKRTLPEGPFPPTHLELPSSPLPHTRLGHPPPHSSPLRFAAPSIPSNPVHSLAPPAQPPPNAAPLNRAHHGVRVAVMLMAWLDWRGSRWAEVPNTYASSLLSQHWSAIALEFQQAWSAVFLRQITELFSLYTCCQFDHELETIIKYTKASLGFACIVLFGVAAIASIPCVARSCEEYWHMQECI